MGLKIDWTGWSGPTDLGAVGARSARLGGPGSHTGNDWCSDRPLELEVPEQCSSCGYRPVTIGVVEIEGRHSERGHRPE